MKIISLKMQNFMPYKGNVEIDFPIDEQKNVMVIFGDNMRGKTSFLNAIRWGFYGKAMGRHSSPIPLHEMLNREASAAGDWTMEVSIQFEDDGCDYQLVRRAAKRDYVSIPERESDYAVEAYLKKNGTPVLADQVVAEVNRIVPEQVSRFFLFDGELLQEYETLLIQDNEQGRQIKEAIEQVLGVPSVLNGEGDLAHILKGARKQQRRELAHVEGLEYQAKKQEDLLSKQETAESDARALTEQLEQIRSTLNQLEDEIEASEKIHEAKVQMDAKSSDLKVIHADLDQKRIEKQSLLKDGWRDLLEVKVQAHVRELQRKEDELRNRLRSQYGTDQRIKHLTSLVSTEVCPTCEQTVPNERREQIAAELGQLEVAQTHRKDVEEDLASISSRVRALINIRGTNLRVRLSQNLADSHRLEVRATKTENEIERLQEELKGHDTVEGERKRAQRDQWLREENTLQNKIDENSRLLDQIRSELSALHHTIHGQAKARAQKSTQKAEICMSIESIFSKSVDSLRDRLKHVVEKHATEAFKELTTQKAYSALRITDNYGLNIIDENGDVVTVRSAGAEQIVALSLIDGLNQTGKGNVPVVMDTPFGRLDLQHRDNILQYLPKSTSQFVLLVHSGEVRKETDLLSIANRIGATYEICEIGPRHSAIERIAI